MPLPHPDFPAIRAWLGEREIAKGRPYTGGDALTRLRQQGRAIKADYRGTAPTPYRVEVTFSKRGIRAADCSCPVGAGGRCKHVAALLLAWLERPDDFLEVPTLKTTLEGFDRAALIGLVTRMLERHPDMESLVEIAALAHREEGLAPDALRPLVRSLLEQHLRTGDWEDVMFEPPDPTHLGDLIDALEERLARGDIDTAAAGFDTIAGEILEVYNAYEDEEGTLASLAQRCAEGLAACLAATEPARDARLRHTILTSLFELYCQDLDTGGYGIGDIIPDAIAEHATSDEREVVAGWIDEVLPEGSEFRQDYERQALGRFLLAVREEALDEDAILSLLRRSGNPFALLDKLLEFGRHDDAVDLVRAMPDHNLLLAADRLVAHDHAAAARRLVEARQAQRDDIRFLTWLRDHAEAQGDLDEALRLSETLFWHLPILPGYQRLEQLAESLGRWPELRPAVLDRLERERESVLLTEIHLHEGDTSAALTRLRELGDEHIFTFDSYVRTPLAVRVAEAAAHEHPEAAAELYERQAEAFIALRGRQNYTEAAALLLRARGLRRELGQEERWHRLIEELRGEHRRLRALMEELDKVDL